MRATGYRLHFQWQKDLSDLCDGGRYHGTSTDTLFIVDVKKGDKGRYRCLVKNDLEEMFTNEAFLTVCKLIINVFHVIYTAIVDSSVECDWIHIVLKDTAFLQLHAYSNIHCIIGGSENECHPQIIAIASMRAKDTNK